MKRRTALGGLGLLAFGASRLAQAMDSTSGTQLTFYGQSAFRIVTPRGAVLLVDPWLRNPLNPHPDEPPGQVDYILITHGHFDHVGEAVAIGKRTGARLIACFELSNNLVRLGGYPATQAGFETALNIGGEITIGGGEVRVAMTQAVHSSGMTIHTTDGKDVDADGGAPGGFVITIEGGPTIYHSGDTAYFSDMAWIGRHYKPDVALLNIGGRLGMQPDAAAMAAKDLGAPLVIPHHFATFPVLTPDARGFFAELDRQHIGHRELKPGQSLAFEGRRPAS